MKEKRLLKTAPSPGGSGELGTSPFASLTTTTLRSHSTSFRSGRITCGYEAPGVAPLPPKLPSATSHIRETLSAIADQPSIHCRINVE